MFSVERYDEGEDKWQAVASMSFGRMEMGVCVLGGRLYAVGGRSGINGSCLSSVERYDEGEDKWESVASMSSGRVGVGAAAVNTPVTLSSSTSSSSSLSSSSSDAPSLDLDDN